jgi:hypothetical protein
MNSFVNILFLALTGKAIDRKHWSASTETVIRINGYSAGIVIDIAILRFIYIKKD